MQFFESLFPADVVAALAGLELLLPSCNHFNYKFNLNFEKNNSNFEKNNLNFEKKNSNFEKNDSNFEKNDTNFEKFNLNFEIVSLTLIFTQQTSLQWKNCDFIWTKRNN